MDDIDDMVLAVLALQAAPQDLLGQGIRAAIDASRAGADNDGVLAAMRGAMSVAVGAAQANWDRRLCEATLYAVIELEAHFESSDLRDRMSEQEMDRLSTGIRKALSLGAVGRPQEGCVVLLQSIDGLEPRRFAAVRNACFEQRKSR